MTLFKPIHRSATLSVTRRLQGFRCQSSLVIFLPSRTRSKPFHLSATLSGHSQTSRTPVPIWSDMFHNMHRVFQLNPYLDIHIYIHIVSQTDRQTDIGVVPARIYANMHGHIHIEVRS